MRSKSIIDIWVMKHVLLPECLACFSFVLYSPICLQWLSPGMLACQFCCILCVAVGDGIAMTLGHCVIGYMQYLLRVLQADEDDQSVPDREEDIAPRFHRSSRGLGGNHASQQPKAGEEEAGGEEEDDDEADEEEDGWPDQTVTIWTLRKLASL